MLKPEDCKIGALVTIDINNPTVHSYRDVYSWNKFYGKIGEVINVKHKEEINHDTGLKISVCTVWFPQLNEDALWFHGYLNKIQNAKT